MSKSISSIYEYHHTSNRGDGFSILKDERGQLISSLIGSGKTVLDLGCRDGALTKFFIKDNNVTGTDVDLIALEKASKLGISTLEVDLNGDWSELQGKKYDVIVAGEVLEHLYFPEKIMSQVRTHLKEGGLFIGSVPNAFSLKNRMRLLLGLKKNTSLNDPTHINHFAYKELRNRLLNHFSKVHIHSLGRYARWDRVFKGMFSYDLLFVAKN